MKTNILIGEKKQIIARVVISIVIFLSFVISMLCAVDYIVHNAIKDMTSMVNFAAVIFVSVFALFELIVVLKNIKKELAIINILFNQNDTINRLAVVVANIFLFIGLFFLVFGLCVYLINYNNIEFRYIGNTMFDIGLFTFLNCALYDFLLIYFLKLRSSLY
ncbi:MAG: hypothetical protein ACI31G_02055 [Bacilli bacterium]